MRKYLLVGAAGIAFVVAATAQQNLTNRTMAGTEVVVISQGGPGGASLYAATAQMRNSQGVAIQASGAGNFAISINTATTIFTAASGGAQVITLPPLPYDGQITEIVNGTAATAFTTGSTVATSDGSTITGGATANALGTLAAGVSAEWRYSLTNNIWYRMR
jgi:ABC-type Fe3+-siderophore transport system permease subunit